MLKKFQISEPLESHSFGFCWQEHRMGTRRPILVPPRLLPRSAALGAFQPHSPGPRPPCSRRAVLTAFPVRLLHPRQLPVPFWGPDRWRGQPCGSWFFCNHLRGIVSLHFISIKIRVSVLALLIQCTLWNKEVIVVAAVFSCSAQKKTVNNMCVLCLSAVVWVSLGQDPH